MVFILTNKACVRSLYINYPTTLGHMLIDLKVEGYGLYRRPMVHRFPVNNG